MDHLLGPKKVATVQRWLLPNSGGLTVLHSHVK